MKNTFEQKPKWLKSYTFVLLANVLYIIVFFLIMKIFS